MKARLSSLLVVFCLVGVEGCCWTNKAATHHTLVLGVGFMSTKSQTGVNVEDCRALGVTMGRAGFNAGLIQQHQVEINPNTASNVIISIKATPFSLTVTNFSLHPVDLPN